MRDIDQTMDAALKAEERDLLRRIGEEPGFFNQTLGVFGGSTGWVNALLMLVQTGLFLVGAWAGWRFFQAAETLEALRWGLPSAVLLLMALNIKLTLWPTMQANRVLRALKLMELRLAKGE